MPRPPAHLVSDVVDVRATLASADGVDKRDLAGGGEHRGIAG